MGDRISDVIALAAIAGAIAAKESLGFAVAAIDRATFGVFDVAGRIPWWARRRARGAERDSMIKSFISAVKSTADGA